MKKLHLFKTVLLLCALIVGSGSMWATDFTLSSASSVTIDNITVSFAKGSGSTAPTWYDAGLRLYASNTVTITSTAEKIAAITFNWEKQGSKTFASATASTGSYTHPNNTGEGNWSGSTASVTFTLGSSGQLQLNTLSVTLESPAPSYTITAVSNNNTLGTVSLTGSTITATPTSGNQVSTSEPYTVTSGTATVAQSGNVFTVTPSTDCTVRINFVPIPTYVVTIETPTGGTLVVKNGDDDVASGDAFPAGTVLSITATPGAEYNFRNIQVVDASTHTYTASNTKDYTLTANNTTIKANFDAKVYHNVNWSVNGSITTDEVEEGTAIAFPSDPADLGGKSFVGWSATAIVGTTDEEPSFVTSADMGNSDITYYAVFATVAGSEEKITDNLTRATTGITGTSYSDWSGIEVTSDAVYAGNSAGGNSSIQLRSKDSDSGIVTTTSGGKVKKVTVDWNSNTAAERTLNVYGKNSAYSEAADLYGDDSGDLLGTINYGTTELTITGDYKYVGLRSASGAMYLNSVSIDWEISSITYSGYCTSIVETATVTDAGYATYVTKNNVEFAAGDAYTVSISGNKAVLNEVTRVQAGTAVVLKGEGTKTATVLTETPDAVANDLKVSDGSVAGDESTIYVLAQKTSGVGFYLLKNGVTIPDGKAYLVVAGGSAREFIGFEEGETTSLREVRGLKADVRGDFYDLSGRKVAQPTKGLYIVNGRKVVIK